MTNVLGVIGAGGISRFHFQAFEDTGTRVRIIADLRREVATGYVEQFGADYAADYRDVVTHPEVTAVIVLASSPMHCHMVKEALEAVKHVVCEKTLTLSAEESLGLGRLAEERGLILFTSYMKRFFPAVQRARELMPRLGHITSVYCRTYQGLEGTDAHTGEVPIHFRRIPDGSVPVLKLAGGGVLVCGGSHILDLLLFLVGKPQTVYGRRFTRDCREVDIMFHALMDLPDGGEVHFEGNWHPLKRIGYEKRGWDEGFEISGINGRLVLQTPVWCEPEHNAAALSYYDNAAETWTEFEFDIVNPFAEAERHFLTQLDAGEQGEFDRYQGYRVDQLIESLNCSADTGVPVKVPWRV